MLTKNHLNFRTRSGRVYPQFINRDDKDALALASSIVAIPKNFIGKKFREMEESVDDNISTQKYSDAFKKLLFDRIEKEQDSEVIQNRRLKLLQAVQQMRQEKEWDTIEDFKQSVSEQTEYYFENDPSDLYGDLDHFKTITHFKELNNLELIDRYNIAQIQGLLLHSQEITITVSDTSPDLLRPFFRMLKFNRLFAELSKNKKNTWVITISGPMAIFGSSKQYGMRIANFFPYVVLLPEWKLTAILLKKEKILTIKLNSKDTTLRSHYKKMSAHIPEEFSKFIGVFNKKSSNWKAAHSDELLNLGEQNYCIPDVVYTSGSGKRVSMEIFHKWHGHQVKKRMIFLKKNPESPLIIAVQKELIKDLESKELFGKLEKTGGNVVTFSSFPLAKDVLKELTAY